MNHDLPVEVEHFLNGKNLKEKTEIAIYFVTVNDEGFPYKALLSVGELLKMDERTIRIALWERSSSVLFAKKTKKATLLLVLPPKAFDILLELRYVRTEEGQAIFEGKVRQVKEDQAPYATIVSPVQFQLKNEKHTLDYWVTKQALLKK
ncbi:hypothetical protein [Bacillus sp. Marseille-P3800]|uniref:hypothetical protein n=1 Tax=Bacillus sp. Marseille-P3800 TaxID=2014782 RepID=UPI000C06857F|nr:hypothetical protein [Bacillus sp. Marseille-P3800]